MWNPFKYLKRAWNAIFGKIKDPKFRDAVENAIEEAVDVLELARPVVEMLAAATPSNVDDLIVKAALSIGRDIQEVFAMEGEARGIYLRNIAREAIRSKVLERVLGGKSIKIGDVTVATAEQVETVSTSLLNRVVEIAYGAIKKTLTSN